MADENTVVEVQSADTIDALLQRLAASAGRNVSLIIPQGAPVPATLPEFEQLRELERRTGMRLTLVVDPRDRTRFGLAKILSFNVHNSDAPAPQADTSPAPAVPPITPVIVESPTASSAASLPAAADALPADIESMNFDADELDAAAPPSRPRVIGGDPFSTPSESKPATPASGRRPRRSPRASESASASTSAYSSGIVTPHNTGKVKIKAKTLGGIIDPDDEPISNAPATDGLRLPASVTRNPRIPTDVLEQTEPIIPDDTGLGIPAARKRRRDNTAAQIAASADLAASPDVVTAPSPTMKVKVKTNNGEWTTDSGTSEASAATSDTRAPSQSKSAAAVALPTGSTTAARPSSAGTGRLRPRDLEAVRKERERTRSVWFVGLAVAVVLLIVGAAYFLFNPNGMLGGSPPSATVTLVPRSVSVSQQVSVPITVNQQAALPRINLVKADYRPSPSTRLDAMLMQSPVATDTKPLTGTNSVTPTATLPAIPSTATAAPVEAQVISVVISETGTISTTGVRKEPRGNDTTTLKIVNPNTYAVTIAAGTRVPGGGTQFAFPNSVTVPASNLLGGYIGTIYADVQAAAVGPTGVAAFTMSGNVAGVQYQNTSDASGATIVDIPIVSESDYNNLVGGLIAKAEARVPDEIGAKVNGRTLITQTITLDGSAQVAATNKVGEDASTLTATVARAAHAYAFKPEDASAAAIAALQQSIIHAAPNVALDKSSIKVAAGQLQPSNGGYVYQASATASGTYIIDQAIMAGVKQMLIGQSASDPATLKRSILAKYPTLADVQLEITNGSGSNDGLLPQDKITVKAAGTVASSTPAATPTK